jgi:integrase
MINRDNWKLTRAYLKYRLEVDQLNTKSVRLEEGWLRYVLEWAGDKSFQQVDKIRPTLPEFMLTARLDGKEGQLSPAYIHKVISSGKHIFGWLTKHRAGFSGAITPAWLDTLKLARMETSSREHEAVRIEEVRAMAVAPVASLRDRRIRAAAVFWFLSGIRVGAFVTLPINRIDLENHKIYQGPKWGSQTKNGKSAITYLLDIPDLMIVVREWDDLVRSHLPDKSLWFAPLSPETGNFDESIFEAGAHRQQRANKDLREWLDRVGLHYHSAHKFRHGHAVYALKHSKDIADLKAVSQNLMHSNLSTTDGVYGILSSADVGLKIAELGKQTITGNVSTDDIANQLIQFGEMLKKNMSVAGTK